MKSPNRETLQLPNSMGGTLLMVLYKHDGAREFDRLGPSNFTTMREALVVKRSKECASLRSERSFFHKLALPWWRFGLERRFRAGNYAAVKHTADARCPLRHR